MPTFDIKDIGKVTIRKSRLAKNIVMRVNHHGEPTVTIPSRMPYYLAKRFIWQKRDWFARHRKTPTILLPDQFVGTHKLDFVRSNLKAPSARVSEGKITVKYPASLTPETHLVQQAARSGALRAIKNDAEDLLPPKLAVLARQHGYTYSELRLRNMRSRWGSCSTKGVITLNTWLLTLPEDLINYVCCHELAHLDHHNHSKSFWQAVETMLPEYKSARKLLKTYSPSL